MLNKNVINILYIFSEEASSGIAFIPGWFFVKLAVFAVVICVF